MSRRVLLDSEGGVAMLKTTTFDELEFIIQETGEDEVTVLAQAFREGVKSLYRQIVMDAFVAGKLTRAEAAKTLGLETVRDLEYQKDALRKDIQWGLRGE
jgi:hypothetical protein